MSRFVKKGERTYVYTLKNKNQMKDCTNERFQYVEKDPKVCLLKKWCWESWAATCRRRKFDPYLTPYMKTNSKWMKDLYVRAKSTKLLEESIGASLHGPGCQWFLSYDTKTI